MKGECQWHLHCHCPLQASSRLGLESCCASLIAPVTPFTPWHHDQTLSLPPVPTAPASHQLLSATLPAALGPDCLWFYQFDTLDFFFSWNLQYSTSNFKPIFLSHAGLLPNCGWKIHMRIDTPLEPPSGALGRKHCLPSSSSPFSGGPHPCLNGHLEAASIFWVLLNTEGNCFWLGPATCIPTPTPVSTCMIDLVPDKYRGTSGASHTNQTVPLFLPDLWAVTNTSHVYVHLTEITTQALHACNCWACCTSPHLKTPATGLHHRDTARSANHPVLGQKGPNILSYASFSVPCSPGAAQLYSPLICTHHKTGKQYYIFCCCPDKRVVWFTLNSSWYVSDLWPGNWVLLAPCSNMMRSIAVQSRGASILYCIYLASFPIVLYPCQCTLVTLGLFFSLYRPPSHLTSHQIKCLSWFPCSWGHHHTGHCRHNTRHSNQKSLVPTSAWSWPSPRPSAKTPKPHTPNSEPRVSCPYASRQPLNLRWLSGCPSWNMFIAGTPCCMQINSMKQMQQCLRKIKIDFKAIHNVTPKVFEIHTHQ